MGAATDKATSGSGDSGGQTTGHSAQAAQAGQMGQKFDLMSLIGSGPGQLGFNQQSPFASMTNQGIQAGQQNNMTGGRLDLKKLFGAKQQQQGGGTIYSPDMD